MRVADRRRFLTLAMSGAVVATAAAAGLTTVLSTTADAAPPVDKALPDLLNEPIEQTQWVDPAHRRYDRRGRRWDRRHNRWDRRRRRRVRRRVCWWHRGRKICDWRWM